MLLHTIMHHPVLGHLRKKCSTDVGFLILRVVVGAVFIYHGHMKLWNLPMAVGFFDKLGIPMAGVMAPFVSGLEFFGGILLIVGVATRLLGLMLAFDMAVAMLTTMKMNPGWGKHELELLLFAGSLLFLLAGAGECSVDNWLMKKSQKAHEDALPAKS